jgi:uncharacterized protein (TIGR01777 family)
MGIRVVNLRFGVVLAKQAGALAQMLPVFNVGMGGKLGSGQQAMSWISINEIPGIIDFVINNQAIAGPVNVVSPTVVTNKEFTATLCAVLKRPEFLPVPSLAVKILFGQMGDELLLQGVNVFPGILIRNGYHFKYPHLKEALVDILNQG